MNWLQIWDKKGNKYEGDKSLESLLEISGFTSDDKKLPIESWLAYIHNIKSELKIDKNDKIFEAGCGSGALLLPFYDHGFEVAGIDYSENMLKIAKNIMPRGVFTQADITCTSFESNSFQVALCNSVFLYLNSYEQAESAIKEMIRILGPNGKGAVLDIPDVDLKEASIQAKIKTMGIKKFNELYLSSNLQHQYYQRDWFKVIAEQNNLECRIESQNIEHYTNSNFRFNFFFKKK